MLAMLGFVVLQVALSLGGLYKIKTAPVLMSWDFAIGFGLYTLSFFTWVYILRSYPLSIAFPLAVSLSVVFSQFIGIILLNEGWSWGQVTAILIIISGIAMLSVFKVSV